MWSELKLWFQSRIGRGFPVQLEAASVLLTTSLKGSEAIRRDLNMALDLINALRKAGDGEKEAIVEKYRQVLASIDRNATAAAASGKSLIDGSDYQWTLSEGAGANWLRKLEHIPLVAGKSGLDLPVVSDLDNRDASCDEAQRRVAGAIKAVNKASTGFSSHQKAVAKRLERIAEDSRREATAFPDEARESLSEIAQIVVVALLIALVFRSFFFQPFNIPSGSMKSTLLKGDYLFVSKYAYGFSHNSFPFSIDFFEGRIFNHAPKRGDVIVFKMTRDGRTDYIKRLVGLPGDKLQMKNGILYINDTSVRKEVDGDYWYKDDITGEEFAVSRYRETLPNGVVHTTLDMTELGRNDTTGIYRVPDGHYFFMGDNRDNSQDSRVIGGGVGFVPEENLVGRAEIIFFSVDGSARIWQIWRWPTAIRYSRMFKRIE